MIFILIAIASMSVVVLSAAIYLARQKRGHQPNPVTFWATSGVLVGIAILPYPLYQVYKALRDLFGFYTPIAIPMVVILVVLSFGYAAWELGNILKARRQFSTPIVSYEEMRRRTRPPF